MIVYHGSTEIIRSPDVVHSKKYLDFGAGIAVFALGFREFFEEIKVDDNEEKTEEK